MLPFESRTKAPQFLDNERFTRVIYPKPQHNSNAVCFLLSTQRVYVKKFTIHSSDIVMLYNNSFLRTPPLLMLNSYQKTRSVLSNETNKYQSQKTKK